MPAPQSRLRSSPDPTVKPDFWTPLNFSHPSTVGLVCYQPYWDGVNRTAGGSKELITGKGSAVSGTDLNWASTPLGIGRNSGTLNTTSNEAVNMVTANPNANWTVELWAWFRAFDTVTPFTSSLWFLNYTGTALTTYLTILGSGSNTGKVSGSCFGVAFNGNKSLVPLTPYQITITYDANAGAVKIYLNGAFDTSTPAPGPGAGVTWTFVTAFTNGANHNPNATFTSLRAWQRALDAGEILNLYAQPWCMHAREVAKLDYSPPLLISVDNISAGAVGTISVAFGVSRITVASISAGSVGSVSLAPGGHASITVASIGAGSVGSISLAPGGHASIALPSISAGSVGSVSLAASGHASIALPAISAGSVGSIALAPGPAPVTLPAITAGSVGSISLAPGPAPVTLPAITAGSVGSIALAASGSAPITLPAISAGSIGSVALTGSGSVPISVTSIASGSVGSITLAAGPVTISVTSIAGGSLGTISLTGSGPATTLVLTSVAGGAVGVVSVRASGAVGVLLPPGPSTYATGAIRLVLGSGGFTPDIEHHLWEYSTAARAATVPSPVQGTAVRVGTEPDPSWGTATRKATLPDPTKGTSLGG